MTTCFSYNVCLSFRGEDTRKTFTDLLYAAPKQAGIRTFMDDDAIDQGKLLGPELKKAIHESAISIIVFSRNYASSGWCHDEVLTIIQEQERLSSKHEVVPVFYNVESSDVRNQTRSFEEAFGEYDNMMEAEIDHLKKNEWREKVKAWVISLRKTGMGMRGIGKTTLSKCIYNSNYHEYDGSCFLADIHETSNQYNGLLRLQTQLLSTILRSNKEEVIWNLDEGIVKVANALCNKKVLLILDDVTTRQKLIALLGPQQFYPGSKIIITNRHKWLLTVFKVHPMVHTIEELGLGDSNKLFSLYLERLALLDISGCRSLKDIPRLPRSLVSLKMYGCSNLGGVGRVQCLDSFSLSSLLVDIDVSGFNLFDNSFPDPPHACSEDSFDAYKRLMVKEVLSSMATRNRTFVFRRYRDALKSVRVPSGRSHVVPSSSGGGPVIEMTVLKQNRSYVPLSTDDPGTSNVGAPTVGLPPAWVDVSEELAANIQRARSEMADLAKAHAKALMPSFGDGKEDQHRIEALTHEVTDLLKRSEKRLRKLYADGPFEDSTIRKNVQRSLASDLQSLSVELRRKQSNYLKCLKQQKEGSDGVDLEMNLNGKHSIREYDGFDGMSFNKHQMAKLKKSEALTVEREKEIQQVAESVNELAQIMKDLSFLVIDQGTIIDRIDYNIQNVAVTVDEGLKQLQKAERNQKQGGMVMCATVLVIMCFVMLVLLILKGIIF
ncbi:hypothetical protein L1987_48961 [Smallanthus sonchifolius]|uniref:Uncharacterized protein n=1 Tax=Smallanthus sonchifolius TaxID=185202 RepID=A0ACB9FUB2_9ASTR|nr:hypothetical protein L1987_48961 [Smallanthus sonchifolius]